MHRELTRLAIAALLGLTAAPSAWATDENFIELLLTKEPDGSGGFKYGFGSEGLGKLGATKCEITTPTGSADCVKLGDRFLFEEAFFQDRLFPTFDLLLAEIEDDWTLTWDKDFVNTETVATIDFITERGDITADAWLDVFPMITTPPDESTVLEDTPIEWNYGTTDPGMVDPNGVFIFLRRGDAEQRDFNLEDCPIPCEVTTVIPDPLLALGEWDAMVSNGFDIRNTSEGISSTGDPWVLDNVTWLVLGSVDRSSFTVVPEPSTALLLASGLAALAVGRRRGVL